MMTSHLVRHTEQGLLRAWSRVVLERKTLHKATTGLEKLLGKAVEVVLAGSAAEGTGLHIIDHTRLQILTLHHSLALEEGCLQVVHAYEQMSIYLHRGSMFASMFHHQSCLQTRHQLLRAAEGLSWSPYLSAMILTVKSAPPFDPSRLVSPAAFFASVRPRPEPSQEKAPSPEKVPSSETIVPLPSTPDTNGKRVRETSSKSRLPGQAVGESQGVQEPDLDSPQKLPPHLRRGPPARTVEQVTPTFKSSQQLGDLNTGAKPRDSKEKAAGNFVSFPLCVS